LLAEHHLRRAARSGGVHPNHPSHDERIGALRSGDASLLGLDAPIELFRIVGPGELVRRSVAAAQPRVDDQRRGSWSPPASPATSVELPRWVSTRAGRCRLVSPSPRNPCESAAPHAPDAVRGTRHIAVGRGQSASQWTGGPPFPRAVQSPRDHSCVHGSSCEAKRQRPRSRTTCQR
jgi:hypothetical protein